MFIVMINYSNMILCKSVGSCLDVSTHYQHLHSLIQSYLKSNSSYSIKHSMALQVISLCNIRRESTLTSLRMYSPSLSPTSTLSMQCWLYYGIMLPIAHRSTCTYILLSLVCTQLHNVTVPVLYYAEYTSKHMYVFLGPLYPFPFLILTRLSCG